jgi:ABC-2 type transport system ATP-binding protein
MEASAAKKRSGADAGANQGSSTQGEARPNQGNGKAGNGSTIEAKGLIKRFGKFTAVKGVDISIEEGEVFGLLGANGAGKSTIIQMLCGLQKPTEGTVRIFGRDPIRDHRYTHARIGYMNQRISLYDDLTVDENIDFYSGAYGLSPDVRRKRKEEAIEQLELSSLRKKRAVNLPRGIKQKVAFVIATIHEPAVIFLDEPTAGTDPATRRNIWERIKAIAAKGTAILITTHLLDEAEYCNRLALMTAGNIIASGTPEDIRTKCGNHAISVVTQDYKTAIDALYKNFKPWQLNVSENEVRILSQQPENDQKQIEQLLKQKDVRFDRAEAVECTLEEAFVANVTSNGGDQQ